MSNLLQRAITGTLFVGLIIFSLWWGGWLTTVVMGGFLFLGLIEYLALFKAHEQIALNTPVSLFFSFLIFVVALLSIQSDSNFPFYVLIPVLLFKAVLFELWRKKEHPLLNIGVVVWGVIYLVLPFWMIILLQLVGSKQNPLVIGMFLLIWTNDTFAYLSGRLFGKTKLFERISPKKTWEGTIGGILFTVLVGILISFWGDTSDMDFWIIAALLIALTAILGDLLESLFKRSLNIKDSGTILPGHGGILDRFDATLFTVPFFYAWFIIYSYF